MQVRALNARPLLFSLWMVGVETGKYTRLDSHVVAMTAIAGSFRRDTSQNYTRLLALLAQAQLVSCFVLCLPLGT